MIKDFAAREQIQRFGELGRNGLGQSAKHLS